MHLLPAGAAPCYHLAVHATAVQLLRCFVQRQAGALLQPPDPGGGGGVRAVRLPLGCKRSHRACASKPCGSYLLALQITHWRQARVKGRIGPAHRFVLPQLREGLDVIWQLRLLLVAVASAAPAPTSTSSRGSTTACSRAVGGVGGVGWRPLRAPGARCLHGARSRTQIATHGPSNRVLCLCPCPGCSCRCTRVHRRCTRVHRRLPCLAERTPRLCLPCRPHRSRQTSCRHNRPGCTPTRHLGRPAGSS